MNEIETSDSAHDSPERETSVSRRDLDLFVAVAEATSLREGPEGVRRALWELHHEQPRSTRDWARGVRIPVPVIAAVRGELESRGLVSPDPHPALTPDGEALLDRLFGERGLPDPVCPMCTGHALLLPPEAIPLLDILEPVLEDRPDVDVALDQSHALPETALLRALLLANWGLLGGEVLFLGDDDLTSVALGVLLTEEAPGLAAMTRVTVLDIDERYLRLIRDAYHDLGLEVETAVYDTRDPLPEAYRDRYRTALTDPPYTPDGIHLFSWRCAEALGPSGGDLLLYHAPQDPETQHCVQTGLLEQGWTLDACFRDAAHYEGASVHANRSDLHHLRMRENGRGRAPENVASACYSTLYTGQLRSPGGVYRCAQCGIEITVGPDQPVATIGECKRLGCPHCGGRRFHRYGQTSNDRERHGPDDGPHTA